MRKIISLVTLCLFLVTTAASAQTVMPQSVIPAASMNARVGVAAGVKGSVQLARDGGVGKVVSSGAEIFLGDKISTDAKGGLQILLLDQTTFTIGANSAIVVDQFIYDPANDAGKVSVRVVEGTFRFITGKIAHKNPENMQVDLPNGTIGVRGTMVMGRVNGTHSLAILTGPGDKNNTGSRHGAIIVGRKGGDNSKSVRISKTGFGTEIDGDGAPKSPFKVPQAQLDEMTGELSPQSGEEAAGEEKSDSTSGDDQSSDSSGEESAGSEESATEQAGQDKVDTDDGLGEFENIPAPEDVDPTKLTECQDGDEECLQEFLGDYYDFFFDDFYTTIAELDVLKAAGTVPSGIAHFTSLADDLYDSSGAVVGNIDILFDINFNNRTVGGGNSRIESTAGAANSFAGGNPFKFLLASKSFDVGAGGDASYKYTGVPDSLGCSASCSADVYVDLVNVATTADKALVYAVLTDAGNPTASVYVDAEAPRIDGALS